jgi:hypothetical protein
MYTPCLVLDVLGATGPTARGLPASGMLRTINALRKGSKAFGGIDIKRWLGGRTSFETASTRD